MKPEEKCVSKTTAILLRDAGFPQDTERLWEQCYTKSRKQGEDWKIEVDDKWRVIENRRGWFSVPEVVFQPLYSEVKEIEDAAVAAPDAQEIGALLPASLETDSGRNNIQEFKTHTQNWSGKQCQVTWVYADGSIVTHKGERILFNYDNEAEARAACWLYLKENNLI